MILGVAGYGVFSMLRGKAAAVPFQNFTITQVTNSGKVLAAAISPDGKYVLSIVEDGGKMSLWLRNIPTGSNTQVLPPESALYQNPAFSPDGNYIYYSKASDAAGNVNNLYRIPVLGGEAVQLVRDVDVGPTFSPEGQRMAYLRANDPVVGKYLILSAKMDGSDEKTIYTGADAVPYCAGMVTRRKVDRVHPGRRAGGAGRRANAGHCHGAGPRAGAAGGQIRERAGVDAGQPRADGRVHGTLGRLQPFPDRLRFLSRRAIPSADQ